jgi:hypothetical protein
MTNLSGVIGVSGISKYRPGQSIGIQAPKDLIGLVQFFFGQRVETTPGMEVINMNRTTRYLLNQNETK